MTQTKATERDAEIMKDVLSAQGTQPSFILGQLYSACGVTFTEEQMKEIKVCEGTKNE